jgi:hypothetical protein
MPNSHTDALEPADAQPANHTRVPVSGGVLVYEIQQIGRELVGFEAVTDWDDLADGLAVRGHGRGAIHHLPRLDREVA